MPRTVAITLPSCDALFDDYSTRLIVKLAGRNDDPQPFVLARDRIMMITLDPIAIGVTPSEPELSHLQGVADR